MGRVDAHRTVPGVAGQLQRIAIGMSMARDLPGGIAIQTQRARDGAVPGLYSCIVIEVHAQARPAAVSHLQAAKPAV